MHLTTIRGPVRAVMERSGLLELVGRDRIHPEIEDALEAAGYASDSPIRHPESGEEADADLY